MYFLYLAIGVLAFIFNILIVTNSKTQTDAQMGIVPVVQLVFIIPIFIIYSLIFYFTKNTNFGQNYQYLYILLPFLLEMIFFAYTKDLFSLFKADGFVTRSYILSIGLATIATFFLNWLFIKIF
ncbi:hypothetical protein GCM10027035_21680 [Emticicia sediminis]